VIPVGYMAKRAGQRPAGTVPDAVEAVYSVSGCLAPFFCDYVEFWRHNGYWLFDSPAALGEVAVQRGVDLSAMTLFYYEAYEREYDRGIWRRFQPEPAFETAVRPPLEQTLRGYDAVSFSSGAGLACSPLSCNGLARELTVNRHCLLASLETAKTHLANGVFDHAEPGPYRVFAVYTVAWGVTGLGAVNERYSG